MPKVHISLKEHSYDIHIGSNLDIKALVREALPKTKDLLIVTNDTIAPLYLERVANELTAAGFTVKSCILKDGEAYKTVESYMSIMSALLEDTFGRDCALVALGGGVVGDMTGFAAATYQRGVDFVQIPTTLLAMVDSSVGGKTAINHPLGKNMIGAFYQPKTVIADLTFLESLPARELAAGMAEVIKYGVIFDREFFDFLKGGTLEHMADLVHIVKRCCELKADVVTQDEREKGLRALLNYGHTFGHAIEVGMGFGTYLHGEAVAVGMAIAAYVAQRSKALDASVLNELISLLKQYSLPYTIPQELDGAAFISHMRHDKKVKAGKISYILPNSIGSSSIYNDVSDDEIVVLIDEYKKQSF